MRGSWLSKSALHHGVNQERQGHHHEPPFKPVGFFDKHRRDEQPRVFEQPNAPFNVRLTFGGDDARGMAALAGGAMSAKPIAGLGLLVLRNRVVIRMDWGLDVPRDGLERRAWCGTAFASVALVWSQRSGRKAVLRPALGQRCEGRLSGFGSAQAWGLQVKARLGDGRVFARCGVVARGFGTFTRGP